MGTAYLNTGEKLFYRFQMVKIIDFTNVDTSNETDMHSMFSSCSSLTALDLSNFNTSYELDMSEVDMDSMFEMCYSLTSLYISGFDTLNEFQTESMF